LNSAVGRERGIEYQGVTIEFSKISQGLFFGFTLRDRFYMATPQKALLDALHSRKRLPTPDELDLEGIREDALQEMAGKFPKTVSKRVSALLEAHR